MDGALDARWLLALLVLAGCTSQPTATFRETYQEIESGDERTESLQELVEIAAQGEVGPGLEYRATERFIRTDLDLESDEGNLEETRILNQPSLDLILTAGAIQWTQGFDYRESRSAPSIGPDNTRKRSELLQKVVWEPIDLPRVTARVDYSKDRDDFFLDRDEVDAVVEVEDSRGPFDYLYSFLAEETTDNRSDFERDRIEHTFRGTYSEDFYDGALSATLGVFSDERRITTEFAAGDGIPPGERDPIQGLAAVDTTPQIAVLPSTPALIDDDLTTPTGVNIGGFASGGETFWNIGVGLDSETELDFALLHTADEIDPLFVDQFSFSVWISDDNSFWTQVTGSASYTYDVALRSFRISFPSASGEYFKVVNTASPPAAPAIFVTELRVFAPGIGAGTDETVTEDSIRNVTTSLAWRPLDDLVLGYDLLAQKDEREVDDDLRRDEERIDNSVSALWSATDKVNVSVRGEHRRRRDPLGVDEASTLLNGLVDYQVLDTLDVAFNYTETDRDLDGEDAFETRVKQVRTSAALLETLIADLILEQSEQVDDRNLWNIDRDVVAASLTAELTPSWDLTLGARTEAATVRGEGADDLPDPSEDRYEAVVAYQPSSQLTAEVELEWRDTFAGSGLDQRISLDWVPFRDGSIDILLDYQRLVDGTFEDETDRYLAQTRWTMSSKAFLEANYAVQDRTGTARTESLQLSLRVRF